MSKTKKLYLVKRMLAMILAAAMSITMIPSTALAAPADDTAQEIVNTAAEENGDTGDVADATADDSNADGAAVDGSNAAGATADDSNAAGAAVDGSNAAGATADDSNAAGDAATTKPVYEIVLGGDFETHVVYNGGDPFWNIMDYVELQKDGGEAPTDDRDAVTLTWKKKGADGNYAALANGSVPGDVGSYQALFTFPKQDGVHDGAEKTVDCEITKAPLVITAVAAAKPGVRAEKENISVEVDSVTAVNGDQAELLRPAIALEVTGIREAFGSSLKPEDKLQKDGDYVADVTPSLKADASEDVKAAAGNYELAAFTADVVMGNLTETRIVVTLTDKWKEADAVTLHVYDGKPAKVPALNEDYSYEVQYWDETAQGSWKKLEGAEVVEAWGEYYDCKKSENGKVEPPVNIGTYEYLLTYEDESGVYDKSTESFFVVIDPAPVTVTIGNKGKLKFPAGTSMTKVLSQVTYKASAKDRDNKDVTINAAETHIWGTGFNDANVSRIYEPAFTLQEKDGEAWKSISDAKYRMEGGKEYRVIYDGKKAVYNADGSYAHRTGINSGLDEGGEEINGVDANYTTDETPTADAEALAVEVTPGVEMSWNLEELLKDGKAGSTPETAGAKDYDNTPIYANKSDYKNKVKLKGVTDKGKTLNATGSDFTYTWYRSNVAADLLQKQILEQNKANDFDVDDFEDESNWSEIEDLAGTRSAGIYKLRIEYQDNTDDDTFYYVTDDAVAEVYFVVNRVQLTIMPEGTYETLSGRTPMDFFAENKISYKMLDKDDKEYQAPDGFKLMPHWCINVYTQQEGSQQPVLTDTYDMYDEMPLEFDEKTSYEIQAVEVFLEDEAGEYDSDSNFATTRAEKIEEDRENSKGETKKWADLKEEQLGGKAALTVKPMGTTQLTITPNEALIDYEKTYDGKALTKEEVKPETAYTLKKIENGQPVDVADPGVEYQCVNKEDTSEIYLLGDLREAGEYDLYACFFGSETYAPLELAPDSGDVPGVLIGTVKIKKCPITLEINAADTYEAGPLDTLPENVCKVTGYVKNDECDDEWLFTYNDTDGFPAWDDGPAFCVYEKGSKTPLEYNDILHRNREFEIRYDEENCILTDDYNGYNINRNYKVQNAKEVLDTFKTIAAPARISSVELGNGGDPAVERLAIAHPEIKRDKDGNISQTVNVLEGIKYTTYDLDDGEMRGNLAAFKIYAPAEFDGQLPSTAMYENEVKNAGGRLVAVATTNNYFTVLFDAKKGKTTFNIRWEDKYVETITLNFSNDQCLGNLRDAVAPKSLAFNAAPKKLAVGSSVQLDVKIKKAQMADVICLGYKSSDETTMHVDPESGYVTALKKGRATITVYPKQMGENGEMVAIKGAKPATCTIEGTSVTEPKPVKVSAHGIYADVNYDVKDGYRREIYVVDNDVNASLKKAADIEKKVKELQGNKNQWRGTFAIAPIYLDSADEDYNRSNRKYTARLSGLHIDTPYTVYVRNVCEARTLSDGFVITQATVDGGAAGTAVSFKSLKSEETGLDLKLDETVDGIEDVTDYGTAAIPAFYYDTRVYKVEYAKVAQSVKSTAIGKFPSNASDPAADSGDSIYLKLPLAEKKDIYQNPKLEYFVYATDKNGDPVKAKKNEFVSIDRKGKIKLTGITGWYDPESKDYGDGVYVYVYDSNLKRSASIRLLIVADVDSVKAKKKNMKLSVGQVVDLNDTALYNYKAGSKNLTSYAWPDMDMDAVRAAVEKQEEFFGLDGTALYAIKEGGELKLSLTDKNVARAANNAADATAEITFSSTALAPVKKIKAFDITDKQFGLIFTSAGNPHAFRVKIADASKKTILDKCYTLYEDGEVYEEWEVSGGKDRRVKDTYRIDAETIKNDILRNGGRLAKESKYTVTITALCEGVSSRPKTGTVKTTKIPAQDWYLGDYYQRNDYGELIYDSDGRPVLVKPYGGMSILVSEGNKSLDENSSFLRVLSGNSYTLTALPSNRGRVNDTLVWTVGDKKVASVKAAAGTYCITLKGLKPGKTTLEVKSKILGNKVIARYDIIVVAVGDAYKNKGIDSVIRYYGDDEPENWVAPSDLDKMESNAPAYFPLSVGDPRKVKETESQWFSFTAPETGKYRFYAGSNNFSLKIGRDPESFEDVWGSGNYRDLEWLTKGTKVYLKSQVRGGNAVNSSYYVRIDLDQKPVSAAVGTTTVTGQGREEIFEFKAPESGVWQFSLSSGNNQSAYLYLYATEDAFIGNTSIASGNTVESPVGEGDSVWLKADWLQRGKEYTLKAEKISEDGVFGASKQVTLAADETKYLTYTVEKDGYYQFSSADAGSDVAVEINTSAGSNAYYGSFDEKLELRQGDAVSLKVINSGTGEVTFTVTAKDITPADLAAVTGDVRLPANSGNLYRFTAPAVGVYRFTMTVNEAAAGDAELKIWSGPGDAEDGIAPLETGSAGSPADSKVTITADVVLDAGQTVYVNPINNGAGELTIGLTGAKDDSVRELTMAGANITLAADQEKKVIFTAERPGIYTFTTGYLQQDVNYTLKKIGEADSELINVNSDEQLAKRLVLNTGCTVVWTMSAFADTSFTLSVGLEELEELRLGQSAKASVLGSSEAPGGEATAVGFLFTAPDGGWYTFYSEGNMDTYGILYDIDSVDAETCLLRDNMSRQNCITYDDEGGTGNNFAIQQELNKGQTVYLKSMLYSDLSGSFTVKAVKGQKSFD